MCLKQLIIIQLIAFSSLFAYEPLKVHPDVKYKVQNQLEHVYDDVYEIMDALYTFVDNVDELELHQASSFGKIGKKIDKKLFNESINLKEHREQCLLIISELAPILYELQEEKVKLLEPDGRSSKNIKRAVNCIGEELSEISGSKCPSNTNLYKQLSIYDSQIKDLKNRFYNNRLLNHSGKVFELRKRRYSSSAYLLLISACIAGGLSMNKYTSSKMKNVFNGIKGSFESLAVLFGIKKFEGELPSEIMNGAINQFEEQAKGCYRRVANDDAQIYDNREEQLKAIGEKLKGQLDELLKSSKKMNEEGKDLNDSIERMKEVFSFSGARKFWNDNNKAPKAFLDFMQSASNYAGELGDSGSLMLGETFLVLASIMDSFTLFAKKADSILTLVSAAIPITALSLMGIKLRSSFKQNSYITIDRCIANIDGLLTSSLENEHNLDFRSKGLEIFWINKLKSVASSYFLPRTDRSSLSTLIGVLESSAPVDDKLIALDLYWRYKHLLTM